MTLEFKDKDQLVQDVIDAISSKIKNIDFSDGEPLKTIIEAIMNELDLQYWQLGQVYDNSFIDTAYGDDLTNLVKILGVIRREPVAASGIVRFYRSTPATLDYTIPAGTIVESLPDSEGNVNKYQVTKSVTLLTGQTSINANITATEPGLKSNIVANRIIIINNPPIGIESVVNDEAIIGGEDEETDDELRTRAMDALEASGQGTILALTNKISNIAGVKSVEILDMIRGIGTVDILVLGDSLPMPSSKLTEINQLAQDTKAGGIDILIYEPTTSTVNLDITLTLESNVVLADVNGLVNTAIDNYFATLGIGDSFIKNQLSKFILNNTEDKVIDLIINTPSNNVTVTSTGIIIKGTVTLH